MDRTASLRNPPAVPDYQVLRLIGRGAYGEVWLALNVLGQYRAVKVIRRDSFGHEHPFDREFEGLKKYEPISRSHESQVDILHVGRNDAQGYFYYVMELADRATDERANAGPRSDPNELPGVVASLMDPEDYVPRTLHYEIRRHGRMPVGECVQIGLKLTIALEVLHKHGLVHRDVKPSNIIFVDGLPKLADIGMVMRLDETRSFVGTEGFVPPEGPGTPQADIYSLGKVLYEASTGRDSREFPDLPEDLRQLPEKWELAELNEIIVKACAPERHQRYRSAHEMHADLALLDAGKSIRAKRLRERHRFVSVCVAAGCCALLAVFLTSPPYLKRSPAARSIDGGSSSATRKADSGPSGSESPVESSKLHLLWELPAAGLGTHYQGIAANWRQGGEHVIFLLQSTKLLRVSASGGFLGVWDLPAGRSDYFNLSMIADDDRSGADKAFVGWRAGGDLFISVISQNMYESKRFHVQGATRSGIRDDEGISSIDAIKLTDLERDGARELLVSVGTGIGGQFKPRGLYCFNYEDHALLWQHQTGPWVTTVETMDLDGDGLEEVVMGTHAVANGNVASDGTDDQHAYLYALRHDGQTFWLKKLGDDRTAVMPFWVRRGALRQPEIFVVINCALQVLRQDGRTEVGSVMRFDATDAETARYDIGFSSLGFHHADLDLDGIDEVLVTDRAGWLHVLSPDLKLLRKAEVTHNQFEMVDLQIAGTADLEGDSQPEIVLTSAQIEAVSGSNESIRNAIPNVRYGRNRSVVVLNRELNEVTRYRVGTDSSVSFGLQARVANFARVGITGILVVSDKVAMLELR